MDQRKRDELKEKFKQLTPEMKAKLKEQAEKIFERHDEQMKEIEEQRKQRQVLMEQRRVIEEAKQEAEKQVRLAIHAMHEANNQHMKDLTANMLRHTEAYKAGQRFDEPAPQGSIVDPSPLFLLADAISASNTWPSEDTDLKEQWEEFQRAQFENGIKEWTKQVTPQMKAQLRDAVEKSRADAEKMMKAAQDLFDAQAPHMALQAAKRAAHQRVMALASAMQDANSKLIKDRTVHIKNYPAGDAVAEPFPTGTHQAPKPLFELATAIRRATVWPPVDEPLKSQWAEFEEMERKMNEERQNNSIPLSPFQEKVEEWDAARTARMAELAKVVEGFKRNPEVENAKRPALQQVNAVLSNLPRADSKDLKNLEERLRNMADLFKLIVAINQSKSWPPEDPALQANWAEFQVKYPSKS
jgi:hypothetical protein